MTNFGFFSIAKKKRGESDRDIACPNFKNCVAKKQWKGRAQVCEDVRQRLYGLQGGDCAGTRPGRS